MVYVRDLLRLIGRSSDFGAIPDLRLMRGRVAVGEAAFCWSIPDHCELGLEYEFSPAQAIYGFNASDVSCKVVRPTATTTVFDTKMEMFQFIDDLPSLPGAISVKFWGVSLEDDDFMCDYGIPSGTHLDVSAADFRCLAVIDLKGASDIYRVGVGDRLMTLKKVYRRDRQIDFEGIEFMSGDTVISDTTVLGTLHLRELTMVLKFKELVVHVHGKDDVAIKLSRTGTGNDAVQKLAEHFNVGIDQIVITTSRGRLFGGSPIFSVREAITCSVLGPRTPATKDITLTYNRVVYAFRYDGGIRIFEIKRDLTKKFDIHAPFSLFAYGRKLDGSKTLAEMGMILAYDIKMDVPLELSSNATETTDLQVLLVHHPPRLARLRLPTTLLLSQVETELLARYELGGIELEFSTETKASARRTGIPSAELIGDLELGDAILVARQRGQLGPAIRDMGEPSLELPQGVYRFEVRQRNSVFELRLPPEETARDVRAKISDFFSVPAEDIQMLWGGRIMRDPLLIGRLGVRSDTIVVHLRKRTEER